MSRSDQARGAQQRHPALGVPIAVVRKFVEDGSTTQAAVIAFTGGLWPFAVRMATPCMGQSGMTS